MLLFRHVDTVLKTMVQAINSLLLVTLLIACIFSLAHAELSISIVVQEMLYNVTLPPPAVEYSLSGEFVKAGGFDILELLMNLAVGPVFLGLMWCFESSYQ